MVDDSNGDGAVTKEEMKTATAAIAHDSRIICRFSFCTPSHVGYDCHWERRWPEGGFKS